MSSESAFATSEEFGLAAFEKTTIWNISSVLVMSTSTYLAELKELIDLNALGVKYVVPDGVYVVSAQYQPLTNLRKTHGSALHSSSPITPISQFTSRRCHSTSGVSQLFESS